MEKLLDKLEKYEELAYADGRGADWLEKIGEGFKFYIMHCIDKKNRPSIKGFEKYIDNLAKEIELK